MTRSMTPHLAPRSGHVLTTRLRGVCLLGVLLLAAAPACSRRGTSVQGVPAHPAHVSRGVMSKRVTAKRAPATLVAADGTACRVSPERFRDATNGTLEYCDWR